MYKIGAAIKLCPINTLDVLTALGSETDQLVLYSDTSANLNYRAIKNNAFVRSFIRNESTTATGVSLQKAIKEEGNTYSGNILGYRNTNRGTTGSMPSQEWEQINGNLEQVQDAFQLQKENVDGTGVFKSAIDILYHVEDATQSSDGQTNVTGLSGAGSVGILSGMFLAVGNGTQVRGLMPSIPFMELGSQTDPWHQIASENAVTVTSDEKVKQNIESLSETEKTVASSLKSLVKKYKLKSAVAMKGEENARTHVGFIAQEVEKAFSDAGLDAGDYGVFCKEDVHEVYINGVATGRFQKNGENYEKLSSEEEEPEGVTLVPYTKYALRYEELFSFVISTL